MTADEFKNTVMPHHRKMTGVAMAILGDAEDVRDCMQDTLSKLWMIRGELGQKVNIEAYCMRTVRNNISGDSAMTLILIIPTCRH